MMEFDIFRQADDLDDVPVPSMSTRLFGHQSTSNFLARAYHDGSLHHGLLLHGERGIGKATMGYHLANHILSGNRGHTLAAPSSESAVWRQIAQNAHPALVRLSRPPNDTGSGYKAVITVDQIRQLHSFLGLTPGSGQFRIVMIDAADDMNKNASNALLKMLEEPPPQTYFILIAHGSGSVLATIKSRTQSVRLGGLDDDTVAAAVQHLLPETGVEQAQSVARLSDGSVRRALIMLNYGGAELDSAIKALLLTDPYDVSAAIAVADVCAQKGNDVQRTLVYQLVETLVAREALFRGRAGQLDDAAKLAALAQRISNDRRQADGFNLDRRVEALTLLANAHRVMQKLAA